MDAEPIMNFVLIGYRNGMRKKIVRSWLIPWNVS